MNKPKILTVTYTTDKQSWLHLSDDVGFVEDLKNNLGHHLADRIFQECQSGEKIITFGKASEKEIPELYLVEVRENVIIKDLVRCQNCKHWLGIEDESPAVAPCDAYDDDTPFTKMIMTPPHGFCYKGEPKES